MFFSNWQNLIFFFTFGLTLQINKQENKNIFNLKKKPFTGALASPTNASVTLQTASVLLSRAKRCTGRIHIEPNAPRGEKKQRAR